MFGEMASNEPLGKRLRKAQSCLAWDASECPLTHRCVPRQGRAGWVGGGRPRPELSGKGGPGVGSPSWL